jgi:carotenoid cleavage dioxygenase-like enzyme
VSFTSHRPFWVHDFGLTQSKIVVLGAPRYLEAHRIARVLAGREPFLHGLGYHPDEPMFAYVVDRRGRTATRIYELDPGLVLHFANAYDLGGDVVVDAVHYQDDGAMALVDAFYRGQCGVAAPGLLTRLVLRADGSVSREVLSEHGAEMPTIAQAHSSLPYRYTYALKATHELPVGSRILKIDASTKRTQVVDFGPGQFVCEPVFAPAPGHRYEDDGWVLTLVYDGTSHRSYLAVVRADDFTGPLTKVHLPFHVPHGFHGCFVPGF